MRSHDPDSSHPGGAGWMEVAQPDRERLAALKWKWEQLAKPTAGIDLSEMIGAFEELRNCRDLLQSRPGGFAALSPVLVKVLVQAAEQAASGRLGLSSLSLEDRQACCNGLGALLQGNAWIFPARTPGLDRFAGAVQTLTDGLVEGLDDPRQYGLANQCGEMLNLLNWLSRGLKGGILAASGPIRAAFAGALDALAALPSDATPQQWSKACMQLNTMLNFGLVRGEDKKSWERAAWVLLGAKFSAQAGNADLRTLTGAGNLLKDALEKGAMDGRSEQAAAAAARLTAGFSDCLGKDGIGTGEEVAAANAANYLRMLQEIGRAGKEEKLTGTPAYDTACRRLLEWIGAGSFGAAPDLQTLANLASFAKAMDKRAFESRGGREMQALALRGMAALAASIIRLPGRSDDPRGISALLSALAHFWRGGYCADEGWQAG